MRDSSYQRKCWYQVPRFQDTHQVYHFLREVDSESLSTRTTDYNVLKSSKIISLSYFSFFAFYEVSVLLDWILESLFITIIGLPDCLMRFGGWALKE